MKIIIGVVLAFCLTLCGVPAIADDTFQALSKMPTTDRALLTPLSDDQLAAIEGASLSPVDIGVDVAIITQLNICALCTDVGQANVAPIFQITGF
jgi:hypothetical protein